MVVVESFSTGSKKNLMVLRENIFQYFKYPSQFFTKTTILFYNKKKQGKIHLITNIFLKHNKKRGGKDFLNKSVVYTRILN